MSLFDKIFKKQETPVAGEGDKTTKPDTVDGNASGSRPDEPAAQVVAR